MPELLIAGAVLFAAVQLRSASRSQPPLRLVWSMYALASIAIMLAVVTSQTGLPVWATWGVLRTIGMGALGIALLVSPGVRRPLRDWVPVLTDGAIVAGSATCIMWLAMTAAGLPYDPARMPVPVSLLWVPVDVAAATVIIGLALRTEPSVRWATALGSSYALIGTLADLYWARSGNVDVGMTLTLFALATAALASRASGLNMWISVAPRRVKPQPSGRLYVLGLPCVLGVAWRPPGDTLVLIPAVLLLLATTVRFFLITRANRSLWTRLRHQAEHDELTGLLSRQAFLDTLDAAPRPPDQEVLVLDLDGFKDVNDALGHWTGDNVLRCVAEHLRHVSPHDCAIARVGGDEFALLLPAGQGVPVALAAQNRLAMDARCQGVGASAGVGAHLRAAGPGAGRLLLSSADVAMKEAKQAGGYQVVTFEQPMMDRVIEHARVAAAIVNAARSSPTGCTISDEPITGSAQAPSQVPSPGSYLDIDLQPVIDLRTTGWVGFEALVRWHDHGTRRAPGHFLPIVQQSGASRPMGSWVLRRALHWLAVQPRGDLSIAVNVVAAQVLEPSFRTLILSELDHAGIDPARLVLEITEQTPIQHLVEARAVIAPLRAQGIQVALDDFGQGFSSMTYLAELPVDILKIDKSFVDGLGRSSQAEAVVRASLNLAGRLGLTTVAEGVETPAQAGWLREWGCRQAQGYLFSRPLTPQDAARGIGQAPQAEA